MRVAFLLSSFPSLSETFVLDQVTGLIDRGCDVEIFTDHAQQAGGIFHPEVTSYNLAQKTYSPPSTVAQVAHAGAAIFTGSAPARQALWRSLLLQGHAQPQRRLQAFSDARLILARPAFDILHCHFGPNGLRGLSLLDLTRLRIPLITSFYGYDLSEFLASHRGNPYQDLWQRGDLFLPLSTHMRGKLIHLGCDPAKIEVHRLGVRPDRFMNMSKAKEPSTLRVLSVGRLVPKKGLEPAIIAIARLVRRGISVQHTIVGDGPLYTNLLSLIDASGMQQTIKLIGSKSRPEVVQLIANADVLLAPSLTAQNGDEEGTPVVLMEAMSAGLPVVSTLHSGIPEIVQNGVSGFLVPEGDVNALSDALQHLAGDTDLRTKMGSAGRSFIQEHHDIDTLNDKLVHLYRQILE